MICSLLFRLLNENPYLLYKYGYQYFSERYWNIKLYRRFINVLTDRRAKQTISFYTRNIDGKE